jgi:hypothetical protein
VTIDGVWIIIVFVKHLQLVTTSKYYAVTVLHTSEITIGQTRSSESVTISTSRRLVAASNGGRSTSSRFPKFPRSQLPASHSNSSQQSNPSGYLTNSLTIQPTKSLHLSNQLTPAHNFTCL